MIAVSIKIMISLVLGFLIFMVDCQDWFSYKRDCLVSLFEVAFWLFLKEFLQQPGIFFAENKHVAKKPLEEKLKGFHL